MATGLIDLKGRRTHHYDQIKHINAAVKNIEPTLIKMTSTDVYCVTRTANPTEVLKDTIIKIIFA